jgi:hypothetical protein
MAFQGCLIRFDFNYMSPSNEPDALMVNEPDVLMVNEPDALMVNEPDALMVNKRTGNPPYTGVLG